MGLQFLAGFIALVVVVVIVVVLVVLMVVLTVVVVDVYLSKISVFGGTINLVVDGVVVDVVVVVDLPKA